MNEHKTVVAVPLMEKSHFFDNLRRRFDSIFPLPKRRSRAERARERTAPAGLDVDCFSRRSFRRSPRVTFQIEDAIESSTTSAAASKYRSAPRGHCGTVSVLAIMQSRNPGYGLTGFQDDEQIGKRRLALAFNHEIHFRQATQGLASERRMGSAADRCNGAVDALTVSARRAACRLLLYIDVMPTASEQSRERRARAPGGTRPHARGGPCSPIQYPRSGRRAAGASTDEANVHKPSGGVASRSALRGG